MVENICYRDICLMCVYERERERERPSVSEQVSETWPQGSHSEDSCQQTLSTREGQLKESNRGRIHALAIHPLTVQSNNYRGTGNFLR